MVIILDIVNQQHLLCYTGFIASYSPRNHPNISGDKISLDFQVPQFYYMDLDYIGFQKDTIVKLYILFYSGPILHGQTYIYGIPLPSLQLY